MISLKEILTIYKKNELDDFLRKNVGYDLNDTGLTDAKISEHWKFLGNNQSNWSSIQQLTNGEKGLIERITNAIDSVIERKKQEFNINSPENQEPIIKKAFPKYYESIKSLSKDQGDKAFVQDAEKEVIVVANEGTKPALLTFDVIDKGTGIKNTDFADTILSIHKGNKISSNTSYLIGAFGQGGSTSLPFTYAQIIISKIKDEISFTIIKKVDLEQYKNSAYVYLIFKNYPPNIKNDISDLEDKYLKDFFNNESGTLVRMIDTDISRKYRLNEVTKPRSLIDYLNTELFNVWIPVLLIENRKRFLANENVQNRYCKGSFLKLQTSKYVNKKYCGTINIKHNEHDFNINYYVLLPKNESEWSDETQCRNVFEQFNSYGDPILYTVNGQTITTEKYTRINNAGLSFLKYRLLVIINLDSLGKEKFKFFTSNRSNIVDNDLTKNFLEKVIHELVNNPDLIEINEIIANKSIISSIDEDVLTDISSEIQKEYNDFLKLGSSGFRKKINSIHYEKSDEEIYDDYIKSLKITSSKKFFFIDEMLEFVLTTQAKKNVNQKEIIDMYIDKKNFLDDQNKIYMNGRIKYEISPNLIKPGKHKLYFSYYDPKNNNLIESNVFEFEISPNIPDSKNNEVNYTGLKIDLNIIQVINNETICDISENKEKKKITISFCWNVDLLDSYLKNLKFNNDQTSQLKTSLIRYIALFVLYYKDTYQNLDTEEKNNIIFQIIRSITFYHKK